MDKSSIEILAMAMSKVENKDVNYRQNPKWINMNNKLQKFYLALAKDEYSDNLKKYAKTGEKKYAEKMKTAYDYWYKHTNGEIQL